MMDGPDTATSDRQPGAGPSTGLSSTGSAPQGPASSAVTFRWAVLATIGVLALCGLAALEIAPSPYYAEGLVFLTAFSALQQDVPVAFGLCAILLLIGLRPVLAAGAAKTGRIALGPLMIGVVALVAGIWLIRIGALYNHDFTRDEHMAVFDARIFATGRLFWPLAPAMAPYYSALNDLFLLPIGNHEGLVSAYLPVNAAIRALLGKVMPLSLVSPLLVGVAALALWRVAARLWPGDRATQIVVLVLFASSSQVILTGTAAFAMTTHLAFNLVWLALFLRGSRASHGAALGVGFFATGIHQPLFHPLFVLPFLDLLRRQRRWRELGLYLAGYLAIGLFWMAWPRWVASHGVGIPPGNAAEQVGYLGRLATAIAPPNFAAITIMAANLMRFVLWQHLLLVPLALIGLWRCGRGNDLIRALALGVLLTFVAMAVLIPPQGHGWGYRYLHGLIGNLCLLAGFGWCWLRDHGGVPQRAMAIASAVSLLIVLPVHTVMVRSMIAPYVRATQGFARLDADYIVVDSENLPFSSNFVLNRPNLSNRPRMLLGSLLVPSDLARLCPGRTIAFADAPQFAATYRYYLFPVPRGPSRLQQRQRRIAARAGCRVITAPVL